MNSLETISELPNLGGEQLDGLRDRHELAFEVGLRGPVEHVVVLAGLREQLGDLIETVAGSFSSHARTLSGATR